MTTNIRQSVNLFEASHQWATRPADQRFASLEDMHAATLNWRHQAAESQQVPIASLNVVADGEEVMVVGQRSGQTAKLTHWASTQLCGYAGAPAKYIQSLPAELAARNLDHGLRRMESAGKVTRKLLWHRNGGLRLRAITSDDYSRVWNHEVLNHLLELPGNWMPPPALPVPSASAMSYEFTQQEKDVWGDRTLCQVGQTVMPAGLYASDHDMFAFLVDPSTRIDDGTEHGLARGFFVGNSEVGSGGGGTGRVSIWCKAFLFRYVCFNHIVWDVPEYREVFIRHVGAADARASRELVATVRSFSTKSAADDEQRIRLAQSAKLGDTKDDVLQFLFGRKVAAKGVLKDAYATAEQWSDVDGDPRTAWGFSQGLTRLSQECDYADDRSVLDRAAGKVLSLVF